MNHVILDHIARVGPSLYSPESEHDACGVGFIAQIDGKRSNLVLQHALGSLCNLAHRGAIDADAKTGDGAGVLTQIPYKIFAPEVARLGCTLYQENDLGVGMIFLPHANAYAQARAKAIVEEVVAAREMFLFGWRPVPVNLKLLGEKAASTLPRIEQVLVARPDGISHDEFERRLFLARNEIEKRAATDQIRHFYIASFSSRVLNYKGLLLSPSLEKFYKDLQRPEYETALAVYHQRYSTNTFPTWPLSQPFRMLAHNGEINTRRGNVNWMHAREAELQADFWGEDIDLLKPIIQAGGSDSSELDNALEALVMSGRDIKHAMTMLVPPAWRGDKHVSPDLQAFYEFHRCFNEPWDGPAALVFTDGHTVGACLDRNGLRPSRYKITRDGIFSLGSEVGTIVFNDADIIEKGRLGPGEMIAVDTASGKLLRDGEIKAGLAAQRPYGEWLKKYLIRLSQIATDPVKAPEEPRDLLSITQRQVAFGYSSEELEMILKPMIATGSEAVGSMGDDTPLAVLSMQPRLLYGYFKQLFAQVTNPPIDPIREKLVMSLTVDLGWRRNLLGETPEHAHLIQADSPILLEHEFEALKKLAHRGHPAVTIDATWPLAEGDAGLERAIERVQKEAESAVDSGARILLLSDRSVDHAHVAIPMLLAVGAVHHFLIAAGKRMKASIVCETGEARDTHQLACLIGYGAGAVYPYVAFETISELIESVQTDARKEVARSKDPEKLAKAQAAFLEVESLTYEKALKNLRKALEDGLLKIMSKMGISVLGSYRGAQIFEAIGIGEIVIQKCFHRTPSQVGGIGFLEIARESLARHEKAFASVTEEEKKLEDAGFYRFRRAGERHAVSPPVIQSFHSFVKTNNPDDYKKYVASVRELAPISFKDMLEFVPSPKGPIPIDEVESVEDIRRRFTTAGMSLGALSREAHEALAIAMNRIGGKSNSGEGGEDPERFKTLPNGDSANSGIKQIASGRFGVTAAYLASAKEIEIKMAQGAKPGEGGQLPGHKVSPYIARLRHTTPGVMLISPPPHHDIYSIEDLAQLIHDLKEVNPRAKVTVKLVSEAGVGTVAAGVAKAHADVVLISGHDGGTGASPLSSIKNAGTPWELGVAETQQVLMMNNLRDRIVLRTDGGMRTGRDIVLAAMLGAEQFNFGTTALIALGCVYVRQCHLNTCPVGIATQDEKLRAKFKGTPDMVVNFFNGVAREVREILASLGARSIEDVIGRPEYLRQREAPNHPKANTLDLKRLLVDVVGKDDPSPRHCTRQRNDPPISESPLDDGVLQDAKNAIVDGVKMTLHYPVRNVHRSIGTKVSGEIGYQYGDTGLPEGTLTLKLTGSAGQSLGAFLAPGIKLILSGEANDYVGKGMSGGVIVVRPPAERGFNPHENSIVGNTCLYGATGGALFVNGRAGERFGVRYSGGVAVVEGLGDHGCEYMTGGTVVVLGRTGKNFGAGMTGGTAYVLDLDDRFPDLYNSGLVVLERLTEEDIVILQRLIYQHLEETESIRAHEILGDWPRFSGIFWKVKPRPPAEKPIEARPLAQTESVISERIVATQP